MYCMDVFHFFFFSSRRRHTRLQGDWSSDVCSSDLELRPKQRNDGIAAGTGSVNGEIGEKGEALRLSEDRVDRASVGPLQVQRPQHAQLDHAATAAAGAPTGRGQVTLQSRLGHWPALASSMYARRRYPPECFRVRSGRLARGVANCRARWRFTCQTSHAFPSWLWWASLPPRSHAETRRHRERLPTRESLSRASRPPLDLPPQFSHAATSARFTFNPKPVIMTPSSSRTITPTSLS